MWGNTLDYKLFNTLYMTHQHNSCTVKKLHEQAMAWLEEANKINEWDMLVWHKIESHVQTITWSDLQQQIKKPQWVQVVISIPIPGLSRQLDNFHHATYGRNYAWCQYQCYQCGNPSHFKWDCPFYTCQTCDQVAPGHALRACQGQVYDDGICRHYDIEGEYDGNLTRECWLLHVILFVLLYLFTVDI
jgi:hypothetical protein